MIIFLVVIVIIVAVGGMFMINGNSDKNMEAESKKKNLTDYSGLVPEIKSKRNIQNRVDNPERLQVGEYPPSRGTSPTETTIQNAQNSKPDKVELIEFHRNTPEKLSI